MIETISVNMMRLYLYTKRRMPKWLIFPKEHKMYAQFIESSHGLNKNTCYCGVIYYLLHFIFDRSSDSVLVQ